MRGNLLRKSQLLVICGWAIAEAELLQNLGHCDLDHGSKLVQI